MKYDKIIHGFEFIKEQEIPEISAVVREAVYKKNGAKLLFIDREDSNKTFAISFKTIPEDDTGVFHIIEHSVLCGSRKYPVKEPFVELLKGSVKTFLNAFTFSDKTMYPVSSRNDKDFLNLVDVYMDAVLNPVAITKPEIFYQEGWHYELREEDAEMTYKGVVYNEMKGAYSSADEVEMEEISSLLYKDNCYGRDSGGNPDFITDLTYSDFVSSHAKYYHPSNSRIILDGSVDIESTLELLDSFLCEYDYLRIDSDIPALEHKGHREKTVEYEISPSESEEGKARVCLGFATHTFSERRLAMALGVITDAIAGSNESVFKRAMLESGLCEDVGFIAYDGIRDNSVLIEIKNTKTENMEAAAALAMETLAKIVSEGIDKRSLRASFNAFQFRVREQDSATFPMGIANAITALDTWLYDGEPADALSFEADIEYLERALQTDYFEKIIEKYFLNSTHSATLYMIPSATLGEKRAKAAADKLKSIKESMSEKELRSVIELTEKIERWQKTPDTEAALATIPTISVNDVSELPEEHSAQQSVESSVPVFFTPIASRGIVYTTLLFDVSDFDEEELFLLSILSDLYKNVRTDANDAVGIQTKIKTELGGFGVSTLIGSRDGEVKPYLSVTVSALSTKLESVIDICGEILLSSRFDDKTAIGKIIRQIKNGAQEGIAAAGHSAAFARAASYVSRENALSEHIDGIENYLKIRALDKDYAAYSEALSIRLGEVAEKIFTKGRLTLFYSGEKCDGYAKRLIDVFPSSERISGGTKIAPLGVRREGFLIPASVSFASMAGSVLNYSDKMHGSFAVVRSILSYAFLWNSIRVQGGAYGAGFIRRMNGVAGFYTYRDPNAARSVDVFKESADFLREYVKSGENFSNLIIGAIGDSEPLITPKVLSALTVSYYIRGESFEERARCRRELLNTCDDDLMRIADILEKMIADSGICIIGGKEQLDAASEKLDSVIEI